MTMMYGYGYDPTAGVQLWMMLGMGLFGLMFLAGIVLLVMWAVRRPGAPHPGTPPMSEQERMDPALMIARERLAKGDLTPEQYEELARALRM